MSILDIKEVVERIYKTHGNDVSLVASSYNGLKKKAIFIDKEYGYWEAIPQAVIRGTRHPQRAINERKISVVELQFRLDEKFNGMILIDPVSYVNIRTKCWFIDQEYGRWFAFPQNVLRSVGHPDKAEKFRGERFKYSQLEFENLLYESHNGKVKLIGEYRGMLINHTFYNEKYGEFTALPANVIHKGTNHIRDAVDKRVATSIEKYGTNHPMQVPFIATKCAKSNIRSEVILHWKTQEELVCVASFEQKTVRWLNSNKIDFDWQNKVFIMPSGRTYRPDLFLIKENIWVEIKGIFKSQSKEKWDWFHKEYPNSELWDKNKLKSLGVL